MPFKWHVILGVKKIFSSHANKTGIIIINFVLRGLHITVNPYDWQTRGPRIPDRISNLEMLIFVEEGKPKNPEKNPRSKDENQQQTQPTYDTGSGNWTRATLVGGEHDHHCAIPAPPELNTSWGTFLKFSLRIPMPFYMWFPSRLKVSFHSTLNCHLTSVLKMPAFYQPSLWHKSRDPLSPSMLMSCGSNAASWTFNSGFI